MSLGSQFLIVVNIDSYMHSALGYNPQNQVEETYNLSRKTILISAWLMGYTTILITEGFDQEHQEDISKRSENG